MASINFFTEDIKFSLPQKLLTKKWIKEVIDSEQARLTELNFIFCSDEYLLQLNKQYLNHDDYTDILTFDKSDDDEISGDIFISVDRIKDNSILFKQDYNIELRRVIIHGVYHLIGYGDKEKIEKELMTQKENEALNLWKVLDVPRGTSRTKI